MTPPELDTATKSRIEAEEKYRAQVRTKLSAPADQAATQLENQKLTEQKAQAHRREMERLTQQRLASMTPEQRKRHAQLNGPLAFSVYLIVGVALISGVTYWLSSRPARPPSAAEQARQAQQAAASAEDNQLSSFGLTCKKLITDNLKAPSTAELPNYYAAKESGDLVGSYAGGYTWHAYVDAQNSFGAQIRTAFTCSQAANDGTVHIAFD